MESNSLELFFMNVGLYAYPVIILTLAIMRFFKIYKKLFKYGMPYDLILFLALTNLLFWFGLGIYLLYHFGPSKYDNLFSYAPVVCGLLTFSFALLVRVDDNMRENETRADYKGRMAGVNIAVFLPVFLLMNFGFGGVIKYAMTISDWKQERESRLECFIGIANSDKPVDAINLVYKSVYDGSYLNFIDVLGNPQSVSYKTRNYSCSDTVLVFNNIKDTVAKRFILCDKSINTPDNWHKISDYGYIFHYDVYSKDSVESQCPMIRDYVEKYKERNMRK